MRSCKLFRKKIRTPDLKMYVMQPKPQLEVNSYNSCFHVKIRINKKKTTKYLSYKFRKWAANKNQEKQDNEKI